MNILLFLFVGLVAGWLAGELYKGYGFGLVGNIVVGILGALIGGYLFGGMIPESYTLLGSIITATLGALVLLFLIGLVSRRA